MAAIQRHLNPSHPRLRFLSKGKGRRVIFVEATPIWHAAVQRHVFHKQLELHLKPLSSPLPTLPRLGSTATLPPTLEHPLPILLPLMERKQQTILIRPAPKLPQKLLQLRLSKPPIPVILLPLLHPLLPRLLIRDMMVMCLHLSLVKAGLNVTTVGALATLRRSVPNRHRWENVTIVV
jgi:hypothetical protein